MYLYIKSLNKTCLTGDLIVNMKSSVFYKNLLKKSNIIAALGSGICMDIAVFNQYNVTVSGILGLEVSNVGFKYKSP